MSGPSQRIVVIGGVAAGPAAAAEAARVDPDAEVILIEEGEYISYGACEMPQFISGTFSSAEELIAFTPERFEREKRGLVRTLHRVESIDPRRNHLFVRDLRLGDVDRLRYDKLILATGAQARVPEMHGIEAENVFPIRRLSEVMALKRYLQCNAVKHAVVVGGGYIGVEMAEALVERSIRVTILEPQGGLLNRYLSESMRKPLHDAVAARGVQVRNESLTSLDRDARGRVRAVRTDAGEVIGCQAVLICIGVTPRTDLATRAGIRLGASGALAVDDAMRTNLPGIWACGDVVEVRRVVDDRKIHVPLSPVAFRTARVAAQNAARSGRGGQAMFRGVCGASAVRAFGIEIGVAGLREEEAREAGIDCVAAEITHTSRSGRLPGAEALTVRLLAEAGTGRLLGGELVGREGAALRANVLVPLLHSRGTIDDLLELDLVYNPPLAPPRDALLVAAAQVAKKIRGSRSRRIG
jgi:NADPH-dependent 2,4-dienoyl-CoA reductase/sulfur reductase-like enzyme